MGTILRWYGVFIVEDGGLVEERPFQRDELALQISRMLRGDWPAIDPALADPRGSWSTGMVVPGGTMSAEDIPGIPEPGEYGLNEEDLRAAIADAGEIIAREELRSDDQVIIRMVDALEDVQRAIVLLETRVRDWTTVDGFAGVGEPPSLVALKGSLDGIRTSKTVLEEDLDAIVERCAPNTSRLIGPSITASLIARARGLDRLARLPAGTVQILGAEKAFFRHLRGGGLMPKHGFIFQHPWVHRAPRGSRGKAARALAAKTAIAARADFYGGDLGDQLVKAMEKRMSELSRKR